MLNNELQRLQSKKVNASKEDVPLDKNRYIEA